MRMCSPNQRTNLRMSRREERLEKTHPVIPHSFVTVRAHEGDHAESVCNEFVGEHGRVCLNLHHVDG